MYDSSKSTHLTANNLNCQFVNFLRKLSSFKFKQEGVEVVTVFQLLQKVVNFYKNSLVTAIMCTGFLSGVIKML